MKNYTHWASDWIANANMTRNLGDEGGLWGMRHIDYLHIFSMDSR